MKTIKDLFTKGRQEWLDEARETARNLLKKSKFITVEDVLKKCPRPQYIHKNTVGSIFKDDDFVAVGWRRSARPLMNGRQVRVWTLKKY